MEKTLLLLLSAFVLAFMQMGVALAEDDEERNRNQVAQALEYLLNESPTFPKDWSAHDQRALAAINQSPESVVDILARRLSKGRETAISRELAIAHSLGPEIHESILLKAVDTYPLGDPDAGILLSRLTYIDSKQGLQRVEREMIRQGEDNWDASGILFIIECNGPNSMAMLSELARDSNAAWTKIPEVAQALQNFLEKKEEHQDTNSEDDESDKRDQHSEEDEAKGQEKQDASHSGGAQAIGRSEGSHLQRDNVLVSQDRGAAPSNRSLSQRSDRDRASQNSVVRWPWVMVGAILFMAIVVAIWALVKQRRR